MTGGGEVIIQWKKDLLLEMKGILKCCLHFGKDGKAAKKSRIAFDSLLLSFSVKRPFLFMKSIERKESQKQVCLVGELTC